MQSGNTTATTNISINSSSNNNDNGSMPPQQVYVDTSNPNMAPGNIPGLEHQFHSLSFQPGGDGLMVDGGSDNPEDIDDQGGDGEDDPLKLFVGQVRLWHTNCNSNSVFAVTLAQDSRGDSIPTTSTDVLIISLQLK